MLRVYSVFLLYWDERKLKRTFQKLLNFQIFFCYFTQQKLVCLFLLTAAVNFQDDSKLKMTYQSYVALPDYTDRKCFVLCLRNKKKFFIRLLKLCEMSFYFDLSLLPRDCCYLYVHTFIRSN